MIVDLTKLRNGIVNYLDIDFVYSFSKEDLKNTEIQRLDNVSIKGYIRKNSLDELEFNINISGIMVLKCSITLKDVDYKYEINITISGTMVLTCSITLKDVNYDFNIEINDILDRILEENDKKIQNTIDILPIIWENILLEVPIKVVSPNAKLDKTSGDGWKLITEDDL